ncbi:MAG: HAMP domain-containing sensor histidine kinase [Woeseiaceae bacterium]|nr:HAMP domain-containing sensor histidine kinase [Woeseiaceae bacterium]
MTAAGRSTRMPAAVMQWARRLSRSMSFRLLAIFLLLAASFVYFAISALRWVYDTDEVRELIRGHLSLHIEYVLDDIGDPPRIARAIAITETVPVDIRIEGPGMNWASDPRFPPAAALDFERGNVLSGTASGWLGQLENADFAALDNHRFLRIRQGEYSILVSSPKIADAATERRLTPIIVGVGLLLVLLAYLAVRWLFRPIKAIRHGAARIGQGWFDHRIRDVRADQLGDLANDINSMAADVQRMLDAKRQLLLGISHELRTPSSRMRLAVELLADTDGKVADSEGMRGDIREMEKIIATLLEAEHLNSRHAALHLEDCDVRRLVERLLDDYFSRDRDRISVRFAGVERIVRLDEARVLLLLKNLLTNALRYSAAGDGPVELTVNFLPDALLLRVQDHGPGIPAAQREFIGEPFFRGDPSRTRGTGGSGLGLYLATLVARAHDGTLTLDTDYSDGAAFDVRLPTGNGAGRDSDAQ